MNQHQKSHINPFIGKSSNLRLEEIVWKNHSYNPVISLQTLDELLERDNQREEDGFERKIKLGKIVKPSENGSNEIVIVPTTIETKFYHDNSVTNEDEMVGGTGTEEEGTILGEQRNQPDGEEGDGMGPGNGEEKGHDLNSDAYNLGKVLTNHFNLPNLQQKGIKKSLTQYSYDLTDLNKGFGQLIDKKQTLKRVIKTNILLGNISINKEPDLSKLINSPQDTIYKILSREKSYETEALVFFVRDYSGSMQGAASEAVLTQHLFLYSWLMYQYNKKVKTKFILHDTEAKEVHDFNTYYRSNVAGGTQIHPAFNLVNTLIENEQLHLSNNIYVFYGSDGDDWKDNNNTLIKELKKLAGFVNRIGILVARNASSSLPTTLETNIEESNILSELRDKLKLSRVNANDFTEEQIIDSIKFFLTV
ncbi:MAG: hypothetical protein CMP61_12550 [Flavobacteriales bacterium]|nr:hypothetical protein [Flavobacteriales bacterium]|tara:strand:+ start:4248 stop:5507 length:1260 start_codon:yes stop_codon:yes gene_type:complete